MHYRAFISHSHADAKFAAWLQRAIETWRVPTRLRAELGYSRIKPIFRDRTDLRAATSLGDALEDALRHSSALIVVCSSDAADSDWVDQEIARYRAFNPDAPILPIIAAGEPPHCFPESLLTDANGIALEPLAADARKGFDGKRDALLKTIAGIIDVDFDVLKQRDFRRRQQKMGALAALATSVAAVTLYLAYMAYEARDDANQRREQADDLIAFMLGDLREKLEPIGKLDVLDAVGDKALDYFSQLEGEDLTPEVTLNHAVAIRQIGEVLLSEGQHDAALEAFTRAEAAIVGIEEEHDSPERVAFERGQVQFWIGLVYYEQYDVGSARPHFKQYLEMAEALIEVDPSSTVYLQELSYALANIGTLEVEDANFGIAREYFLRALNANEQLGSSDDELEYLDNMSQLYSWLGETEYRSGNLAESAGWYSQEMASLAQLVERSDDKRYTELLNNSRRRLAITSALLGNPEQFLDHTAAAFDAAEELSAFDPSNYYWQFSYAAAAISHSQALHYLGRNEAALAPIDSTLTRLSVLQQLALERTDAMSVYLELEEQRARLLKAHGRSEEAEVVAVRALDALQRHTDGEAYPELVSVTSRLHVIRGDLAFEDRDFEVARQSWALGLPFTEPGLAAKESPIDLLTRATLLDRLGRGSEAEKVRESLYAMGVKPESERDLATVFVASALD